MVIMSKVKVVVMVQNHWDVVESYNKIVSKKVNVKIEVKIKVKVKVTVKVKVKVIGMVWNH